MRWVTYNVRISTSLDTKLKFDLQRFDTSSKTPSCAHLLAAQDIFFKGFSTKPPETILGTLVLEAFAFRIAINSPFHPELLHAYTFLETLTNLYLASPAMQRPEIASFRRSLWLQLPGEIYEVLYKVSFLLHTTPLDSEGQDEAMILNRRLGVLWVTYSMHSEPDIQNAPAEINALAARVCRLYVSATQLILLKVLHQDIKTVAGCLQQLFTAAMADLSLFNTTAERVTPMLICPIAILGTAAIRFQDQQILLAVLNKIRNLTSGRDMDAVMSFLRDVWGDDTEPFDDDARELRLRCAQLDIWLDHSRLRCLTL